MEQEKVHILTKKCEICDKELTSLYKSQLESNYQSHMQKHNKKEDDENGTKDTD